LVIVAVSLQLLLLLLHMTKTMLMTMYFTLVAFMSVDGLSVYVVAAYKRTQPIIARPRFKYSDVAKTTIALCCLIVFAE